MDFNSRTTREAAVSNAINAKIDFMLTERRRKQPPRVYLGASAVGSACERQTQFDYAGAPREKEIEPKTLRIFDRGHVWEEVVKGWMGDAGFVITQRGQRTGETIGFSQMGGRFKGHVDGVILEGPQIEGVGYPCLWEAKCVGSKSFKNFVKNGASARPAYQDQIALYQAYCDLTENPAVLSVTCSDTCEQLHIPVPYDAGRAQRASDRAVRIIEASEREELLPRPFSSADSFECKWCAFSKRCWSLPA